MKPTLEQLESRDGPSFFGNPQWDELFAYVRTLSDPPSIKTDLPIGYDYRSLVDYYAHPTGTLPNVLGVSVPTGGSGPFGYVLGAKEGSLPIVQVYQGAFRTMAFYAFPLTFRGGINVAMGDVDSDGHADIVVGAKKGPAIVEVFSGVDGHMMNAWYAAPGNNGVQVNVLLGMIGTQSGDYPGLWDAQGHSKLTGPNH